MTRSASSSTSRSETIYRLRRKINQEEDSTRLKDLVVQLQIALAKQETPETRITVGGRMRVPAEKNPFDLVLL